MTNPQIKEAFTEVFKRNKELRQQVESLRAELTTAKAKKAELVQYLEDCRNTLAEKPSSRPLSVLCKNAREQLAAEKQRADALGADKERLDWIEKNKTDLEHEDPIGEFQMLEPWRCHGHYSHDMRQALDAARKAVPQEPAK